MAGCNILKQNGFIIIINGWTFFTAIFTYWIGNMDWLELQRSLFSY